MAVVLVGLLLGLSSTAMVLDRGLDPGAVKIGSWVARPQVGTVAIDPYARAELARSGAIPMAANEGLSLTATTDDTGESLTRNCGYRLVGPTPAARFWTLTATDEAGRVMDDPAGRSTLMSNSIIRDDAGAVTIEIGSEARPGNWLPLSGAGRFRLTLRLYGTPLAGNPGETATLPSISRQSCATPANRAVP